MASSIAIEARRADVLEHDLQQCFPELLKFESTPEMEASDLYQRIKSEVERILNAVVISEPPAVTKDSDKISVLAWNIERGSRFDGIVDSLKNHPQLRDRDLLLLTELDY